MATVRPLAYCPTCKVAFPIATRREGGTFVVQNSTTNCPNGHFARILNAHYQAFESEIQATLATHGQGAYRAILALWEKLRRAEMAPEHAQAEAERIRPGLGSIFSATNFSDPTRKAVLEALITGFAESADDEEPFIAQQDATEDVSPAPEVKSSQEMQAKRKGGNRAFQRSLRQTTFADESAHSLVSSRRQQGYVPSLHLDPIGCNHAVMKQPIVSRSLEVMGGTAVFHGTRVPSKGALLDYARTGESVDDFSEEGSRPVTRSDACHRFLGVK